MTAASQLTPLQTTCSHWVKTTTTEELAYNGPAQSRSWGSWASWVMGLWGSRVLRGSGVKTGKLRQISQKGYIYVGSPKTVSLYDTTLWLTPQLEGKEP